MKIINQSCASHFEKYCWKRASKMNSTKLCFGNLRRIKMCTIYLEECTEEAMFVKAVSSEEVTDNSQWMKISLNTADYKSMEDCLYHNLYHFCPGQNVQRKYFYPFSPGNVQTRLCSSFLTPVIPSLQRASNSHFVLHFYPLLPVEHLAHKMLWHFCLW